MADCLNLTRFDGNNDMQVTQEQAKIKLPMANLDHPFPRKAAIIAIYQLLAELGLIE